MAEAAPGKLGILAGGGALPRMLVEACRAAGRDCFVIAFKGHAHAATLAGDVGHKWVRLGAAGKALAALRAAGVRRVVLGLETGHGPLRARLGKPADLERFVEQAAAIRGAGIGLGLTVLLGIAGEEGESVNPGVPSLGSTEAAAHIEHTARVLEGLALGPGDLVYLSPWDRAPAAQVELERKGMREAIQGVSAAGLTDYRLECYRYFA